MNKKGSDLSMTVIVVAAILLIIAIVLIAIFGKGMFDFTNDTKKLGGGSCAERSGSVYGDSCPEGYHYILGSFSDVKLGEVCCVQNES